MKRFAPFLLSLLLCASAAAQRLPDVSGDEIKPALPQTVLIERASGAYRLSDPKGDKSCTLSLQQGKAKQGLALAPEPVCATTFPQLANVSGWSISPRGALVFLDGHGSPLLEFSETETGVFEAFLAGEQSVFFLHHATLATANLPSPAELSGRWLLARPGQKGICQISLEDAVLGGGAQALEDRLILKASECDKLFAALGLFAWRIERELLVLYGKDNSVLTFRSDPEGKIWTKLPADRTPVTLTRP